MSGSDVDLSQDIWVGVRAYFYDQLRKERKLQASLLKSNLDVESFENSRSSMAKRAVIEALGDDADPDSPRGRELLVHKFLGDLFLPGGPYHGVVIDHFGYMANDSLRAPLFQLYLQHPGELQGLQEPIFRHLAWLYIETREGEPAKARKRFEADMSYLAGQLGPVHYKSLVADVMRNFGQFIHNYTKLDTLHDAGGLDALLRWDSDILRVCDSALIDLPTCMARPPMYAKLVRIIFQLTDHLEEQGVISAEEVARRRGILFQGGLEASGRLKKKQDDTWRPLLNLVAEYKNQPLTPRQLLSYVKIFPDRAGCAEALAELKALGSKAVVKAIETDYVSVERSERIRALGVADGIDSNKLLRLTGEAFSKDLGL
jgi:hypothetical protein